jgi:hypothetical protein
VNFFPERFIFIIDLLFFWSNRLRFAAAGTFVGFLGFGFVRANAIRRLILSNTSSRLAC